MQVSTRSPSPARPISVSRRPPSAARQAAGLGEPARDQRGARVVAEAETVARAGGDREHVLDRAADLDAGDVVALVGAQRVGAQQRRDVRRERGVGRGDGHRRRQSARDFLGEARARDHADRRRPHRREILVRERDARRMRGARRHGDEALRQPEERRTRAGGRELARHVRQRRDRRRDDDERRSGAPPRASTVTTSASGSAMPGRYFVVDARAPRSPRACAASRAHSVTARSSRRARCAASAVPHAPAPTIAIDGRADAIGAPASVLRGRTPA